MKSIFFILLITFIIQSNELRASTLSVLGKGRLSCYYSSSAVKLNITYSNEKIKYGAKVYLLSGFGGYTWKFLNGSPYQDRFKWGFKNEAEISAIAPYTWQTNIIQTTNFRSGDYFLDSIQLVIRIHQPDGSVVYDRGNVSPLGYYNTNFYLPTICPSELGITEYPVTHLEVQSVEKY